jgi:hypothetical protein
VTVDHGAEHAIARPEVVVQRAPVSLTGLARDLDQRRVENSVFCERTRSSVQKLLPRVRSIRWHKTDVRFGSYTGRSCDPWAAEARPAILRRYLACAPGARPHIPVDRHTPVEEFEQVALQIPVFRITTEQAT